MQLKELKYNPLNEDAIGKIVVVKPGDKWGQERTTFLFNGVITNQNLREIHKDEVILEFDYTTKNIIKPNTPEFTALRKESVHCINVLKNYLISKKIYFYITDHNGKCPHIRLRIKGLDTCDVNAVIEYKKNFVSKILADVNFESKNLMIDESLYCSKSKLISLEYANHWKPEWQLNKENIIFENREGNLLEMNHDIMLGIFSKQKKKETKSIPNIQFENIALNIKRQIKVTDVLKRYNYDLSKRPTECKLGHDSQSKQNFSWYDDDTKWHCFHCGKGGDIIQLVMEHESCDFKTAMQKLISDFRLNIDKSQLIEPEKYKLSEAVLTLQWDFADFAKKFFALQPFFYDKARNWWLWNFQDLCWDMIDEVDLLNALYEFAKSNHVDILRSKIRTDLLQGFKMVGREKMPQKMPANYIQFKKKLYDLNSNVFLDPSPTLFTTNPIPHEVGACEDTPVIDAIIDSWVGQEYRLTMYEIIAYCMYREYPIHRFFCFAGGGSNGKSCFLKLLQNVVGERNYCSTELEALLDRFGAAIVYKKMICLMGETNFTQLKKTSMLKKLTCGDTIDFEFKGKDRFTEASYAKLIIATNTPPITYDISDGFARRAMIIEFPNKFDEKTDIIATIPLCEYPNLMLKLINILKQLLQNRGFSNEGTLEERRKRYELFSNPLKSFIETECISQENLVIPFFRLYDTFISWCEKTHKRKPFSKKEMGQDLKEMGFERKIMTAENNNNATWLYILGLDIKKDTLSKISIEIDNIGDNSTKPCENKQKFNDFNGFNDFSLHSSQGKETESKTLKIVKIVKDKILQQLDDYWGNHVHANIYCNSCKAVDRQSVEFEGRWLCFDCLKDKLIEKDFIEPEQKI